jgi:hypothetical protein
MISNKKQKFDFLNNLNLSLKQKEYFLSLHKFCLHFNKDISSKYASFSYIINFSLLGGGSIRDALLLDVNNVKDLDVFISLEDNKLFNSNLLFYDLFIQLHNCPILAKETKLYEILNIKPQNELTSINKDSFSKIILENNTLKSFISHIQKSSTKSKLNDFFKNKYNSENTSLSMNIKKLLISLYLETNFTCNTQYNVRVKSLHLDKIENDYGVNINNLIGLIKSTQIINDKTFDIDFLLTKNSSYIEENFDLHICQAAFPNNKIKLYDPTYNEDIETFFFSLEFKEYLEKMFEQEFDYINFIEENLENNDLFLDYFTKYLDISSGFIFNATEKVLSFNSNHKLETLNSLKKHYKNITKKYPYPLFLHNEENLKHSVYDILKEHEIDVLLW